MKHCRVCGHCWEALASPRPLGQAQVRKWSDPVDNGANLLIAVPGGADGPGGCLVCAENFIIYKNQGQDEVGGWPAGASAGYRDTGHSRGSRAPWEGCGVAAGRRKLLLASQHSPPWLLPGSLIA